MKPPPFTYHPVTTAPEAIALLGEHGDEARILAGGQSLIPLMNFRLAQPSHLIDINAVGELDYIRRSDGALAIGSQVRQATLERSADAARHAPLLVEAVGLVAHPPIRHRGTVGGSLSHADPAAELPAAAVALGGEMVLAGGGGERVVPVEEFFQGPFTTALAADEMLVEYRAALWPAGTGWAFVELSRRAGDFAVVGTAALVHLQGGRVDRVAISLCGVGSNAVRSPAAEDRLTGEVPGVEALEAAADAAVAGLEPPADVHGSAGYRRSVARVMVRKALAKAVDRAAVDRAAVDRAAVDQAAVDRAAVDGAGGATT